MKASAGKPRTNKKYRKPDSREGEGYHSRTSQNSDLFAGCGGVRLGLFLLSLESSFCVLWPYQMAQRFINILLRYLSLSESGGKDKTMMMNMMTGAVAINGGVGVMEVRQPIAKNVAQAAEQMAADLAVNAHITLRELKTKIDTVVEKKLPTFKTLMEKEPVAVAQTMVNGAKLTAYENGYAVYEVDGSHTVMAVDRCNDYRYDFTDGTYEVIHAAATNEIYSRAR